MYSDFYEIPLPALRFEKVEETDTKKWKRQSQKAQRENDANDTQGKAESLARKRHAKKFQNLKHL